MITAIAFDLDGTLLTDDKKVSRRTGEMIAKAAATYSCPIVFASARMPAAIRFVATEAGLKSAVVSYDGALCFASHTATSAISGGNSISFTDQEGFFTSLRDLDIFCGIYFDEFWICNNESEWLQRLIRANRIIPSGTTPDEIRSALSASPGFFKILLRGEPSSLRKASSIVPRFLLGNSKAHFNGDTLVEITSDQCDKSGGVATVLQSLGVETSGLMAFGDGENDVSLLKNAAYSVAMANAVPSCKEAAQFVCGSNNEDGIADFLDEFIRKNGS